jgi:hypothetical protein
MESSLMQGWAHHARARSRNQQIVGASPAFVQQHLAFVIRRALHLAGESERSVSLNHPGSVDGGRGFTPR